jgi:hypothetical protein
MAISISGTWRPSKSCRMRISVAENNSWKKAIIVNKVCRMGAATIVDKEK